MGALDNYRWGIVKLGELIDQEERLQVEIEKVLTDLDVQYDKLTQEELKEARQFCVDMNTVEYARLCTNCYHMKKSHKSLRYTNTACLSCNCPYYHDNINNPKNEGKVENNE